MFERAAILAFHQTSRNFYPGINNIKPGYFFAILEIIEELGYAVRETSGEQSIDRKAVLTFDDGYADNCEVLFRLREMDITPVVFAPTDFIGKTNSWEYSHRLFPARHMSAGQIQELAKAGVKFGSHGGSHQAFSGMPPDRIHRELADSKKILEDITGSAINILSYPFGRCTDDIVETARGIGYETGFALDRRNEQAESATGFTRFRIPVYSIDSYYSLRAKLATPSALERRKNNIINALAGGTIITGERLK